MTAQTSEFSWPEGTDEILAEYLALKKQGKPEEAYEVLQRLPMHPSISAACIFLYGDSYWETESRQTYRKEAEEMAQRLREFIEK